VTPLLHLEGWSVDGDPHLIIIIIVIVIMDIFMWPKQ